MGYAKAMLPFGQERMLQRMVRRLSEVVEKLVVVAAPRQELPPLPPAVRVVRDRREGRGPLEGLAAGLPELADCHAAFVTACDVPLLVPGFVTRMFELLAGYDICVPHVDGFYHPLSAAYRPAVAPHVESLLAADRLRLAFLFERVATRQVLPEDLTDVDPDLDTLKNLNRPVDYLAALAAAGLEPTADILARLGGH